MGRAARWGVVALSLALVGAGLITWRFTRYTQDGKEPSGLARLVSPLLPEAPSRPLNILILGLDEGEQRTDVVIVARWNPGAKKLHMISLPRDTMVPIPCATDLPACISPDKLGHAHAYGSVGGRGPALAVATIEGFLGVKVDRYIRLNFEGFAQVIDLLGGLDLEMEQEMSDIGLAAGPHHLNGKEALAYVRFRSDGQGDIGRIDRTHHFLTALIAQVNEAQMPSNPLTSLQRLSPNIKTDLGAVTLLELMNDWFRSRKELAIDLVTLPGAPLFERGLWFWAADPGEKAELVRRFLTPCSEINERLPCP